MMTQLFHTYQLTDKEKLMIDTYRAADEMGKSMYESVARISPKKEDKPPQDAQILTFSR